VREHELSEFEIEHEGLRLKIRKDANGAHGVALPAPALPRWSRRRRRWTAGRAAAMRPARHYRGPRRSRRRRCRDRARRREVADRRHFYRSAEPGAPSFVEVGSTVKKGQVLCIIEAMKLMNEIDSEYDGEWSTSTSKNGQPVQYGERMFAIRTR